MDKLAFLRSTKFAASMAIAALSLCLQVPAQTLARPGWAGSGITVQTWFKHAVLYQIDTRSFARGTKDPETSVGTLRGITERLDYIHTLGIDAILLEPLTAASMPTSGSSAPIDAELGSVDDFDELSMQASQRGLRILLTLRNPDPAVARYWLTRGVAGFYIPGSANAAADNAAMQTLRKLLPGFVGQRILITDADLSGSGSGSTAKSPVNELQLDPAILKLPYPPLTKTAAELRGALEQSQGLFRNGTPIVVTDAANLPHSVNRFSRAGHEAETARLMAAILLLNRSVPVIYAGQELGLASPTGAAVMMPWGKFPEREPEVPVVTAAPAPVATRPAQDAYAAPERYVPYIAPVKPVTAAKPVPPDPSSAAGQELDSNSIYSFYRQLIQMRHGKASVRDGDEVLLDYDNVNALVFIRKPANPSLLTPALVVVCNPSSNPLQLSIKQELTELKLRGSFLRTALHLETQGASMNLDPVSLAPFSVYIGELRY
jgi:glycosidase